MDTPLTGQRKRERLVTWGRAPDTPFCRTLPLDELVPLLQAWLQARLPAPERTPERPRTFSDLSLLLFLHPEGAGPEATLAPPAGREEDGPGKADLGHGSRAKPVACLHPPSHPEVGGRSGLGRGLGRGLGLWVQAPPPGGPEHGGEAGLAGGPGLLPRLADGAADALGGGGGSWGEAGWGGGGKRTFG